MAQPRYILVTFPAQGHINPGLEFAKRLIKTGAEVAFITSISAHRLIINNNKASTPNGLSFFSYSDGYDDGFNHRDNPDRYISELRRGGMQAVSDLVDSGAKEGRPFTCIFYTLCLQWIAEIAHELHLPSALLWVEPAAVFDIFYYYFHGYGDMIKDNTNDPSCSIELPGLPLKLTAADLPSLMDATKSDTNVSIQFMNLFREQFQVLDKESNPKVLVNSFDALEPEAFVSVGDDQVKLFGIGPLIQSAFLGEEDDGDQSKTSFGGDLCPISSKDNSIKWMSSKPQGSVIYVSFGSFCVLPKPQMEEIAGGLLDFGQPFLWVITEKQYPLGKRGEDELSCIEELEKLGKVVSWCSQMEVLSNPSLGCFVTHCGWNSTLESLVCGVPMVAFPRWLDQGTNAKLIEDLWKTGLRVKANKEGVVERDEIKRCLEFVMGDGEIGEEIRRNAKKWKDLGREAVKVGGSSHKNFKAFLDGIDQEKAHFVD